MVPLRAEGEPELPGFYFEVHINNVDNEYRMTTVTLTGVFYKVSKEIWTHRCSNFLTAETGRMGAI